MIDFKIGDFVTPIPRGLGMFFMLGEVYKVIGIKNLRLELEYTETLKERGVSFGLCSFDSWRFTKITSNKELL